MEKELHLTIEFSRELSDNEQNDFWNSLVKEIEKQGLSAGGGHNSHNLDWIIDLSFSNKTKGDIIDEIGDFLSTKNDIILNFEIK